MSAEIEQLKSRLAELEAAAAAEREAATVNPNAVRPDNLAAIRTSRGQDPETGEEKAEEVAS